MSSCPEKWCRVARTMSDNSGRFAKRLPSGLYDVRFQATGFATVYQGVYVSSAAGARLDASLPVSSGGDATFVIKGFAQGRGSVIEGMVRDQSGIAVPRVTVTILKQ